MQALKGPLAGVQSELTELRQELQSALAPLVEIRELLRSIEHTLAAVHDELARRSTPPDV